MKRPLAIALLSLWLLPTAAAKTPPPNNVVELRDGAILTLPPGKLTTLAKKVPPNLLAVKVFRVAGLPYGIAASEVTLKATPSCVEQMAAERKRTQANYERARPGVEQIMRVHKRSACTHHAGCAYQEIASRNAEQAKGQKPFSEAVGYEFCIGKRGFVLALMGKPGAPKDATMRRFGDVIAARFRVRRKGAAPVPK